MRIRKPRRSARQAKGPTLKTRAITLFVVLTALLSVVAAAGSGGLHLPHAVVRPPLVLRDGPVDPSGALTRPDARAVLAGTWAANLVARFDQPDVEPVQSYRRGDGNHRLVIYVNVDPDQRVPEALLDDVARDRVDILWAGPSLAQLTTYARMIGRPYDWHLDQPTSGFDAVEYHGVDLARPSADVAIRTVVIDSPATTVLAAARRPDGTTEPYLVTNRRVTAFSETPLSGERPDYGLVFADQLTRLLDPSAVSADASKSAVTDPSPHTALVRIEDVHPNVDIVRLRQVLDQLEQRQVPYSIAVIPVYADLGDATHPPAHVTLDQRPELVELLRQAQQHGATLIEHGVTHQLDGLANPLHGISGEDYEFVRVGRDSDGRQLLLGPVPDESPAWITSRLDEADAIFDRAGLTRPQLFEVPHYAATPLTYRLVSERFAARYERTVYFTDDTNPDMSVGHFLSQSFPYASVDRYGAAIVPENLGYATSPGVEPVNTPDDIVAQAASLLALHQSTASFFYHPYLDPAPLGLIVDRITALGFRFVSPADVTDGIPALVDQTGSRHSDQPSNGQLSQGQQRGSVP